MTNKQLSIIIVNYKSWQLLSKCLHSFQKYPPKIDYEIIVVDNDSQDNQFENFSKQHPEITLIANDGNYGFSHGCNLGASHSMGEYLLFLNPDTELTNDNAIYAMFTLLKKHSNVGIASCQIVSSAGNPTTVVRSLNPWLLIGWIRQIYKLITFLSQKRKSLKNSAIYHLGWISGAVVLIHKELFNTIGGWGEHRYWMYHEDNDLCYKVIKANKKIAVLTNVTIKHIGGGTSQQTPKTKNISKIELSISTHNYIQENCSNLSKPILHTLLCVKFLLPNILIIILFLPLFWVKKYQTKSYFLAKMCHYYLNAIIRRTWKSPRLAKS